MADTGKLRVHTVSFQADTGDATSQTITFTRSLRENEAAEIALKKAYGNTATVQEKVVKTTAELTREARSLITQTVNQERRAASLVREYTHLASLTGKTAQEQEVLNATYRLGANATKEQIADVAHLVNAQQMLNKSSSHAQKSMRNLRGISQNLGWQMQDTAVQMQMGTDKLVIFSQQGSQMASAFGPTGALVGAFIAVAGALGGVAIKSLLAKKGIKDLKEVQSALNAVFDNGVGKTSELTEEYNKLYKANKLLAKMKLWEAAEANTATMKNTTTSVKKSLNDLLGVEGEYYAESDEQLKEHVKNSLLLNTMSEEEALAAMTKARDKSLQVQKSHYMIAAHQSGLLTKQLVELNKIRSESGDVAAARKLLEYGEAAGRSNKKLAKLTIDQAKLVATYDETIERLGTIQRLENGEKTPDKPKDKGADTASDIAKAFESEYNSLIAQTENTEQEYSRRKAIITAYVDETGDIDVNAAIAYEKLEEWKTNIYQNEYDKKIKIDAAARAKKAKIVAANVKADIASAAAAAAAKEKALTAIHKAQVKQQGKADPITAEVGLFRKNTLELQNQRDEAEMMRNYSKIAEIDLLLEEEKKRSASVMEMIAESSAQSQLQNYSNVLSGMQNVTTQMAAMAEEGSDEAKALFYVNRALALANIAISTSVGASKATEMGPFGIPMAEYIIGFGMAQAAIVAGTTFAGAYDSGGVIPAGQAGLVAENYDEFVGGTMVYNNSGSGLNVTGSKDTANALMGGGGGGVTIYQNITVSGNGDKALQQAMAAAARKGAEDGAKKGYNMVKSDFNTGRGIRRDLKKSIGA